MGLDMYLEAGYPQLRPERDAEELEWRQVMYWRKSNWIHGWFVDVIGRGEDESTKYYPVTRLDLRKLLVFCRDALAATKAGDWKRAEYLLPPRAGFFFGPTDLSDPDTRRDYVEDLEETITGLQRVITGAETEHFRYMAWW